MTTHPTPTSTDRAPDRPWWTQPLPWVELFAAGNLTFLALDIFIAHSTNQFARPSEWIPLAYSLTAPMVLVIAWLIQGRLRPSLLRDDPQGPLGWRRRVACRLGIAVGGLGIAVGVLGMVLHLQCHFFREQSLHNLVYTAPFVAPLSYAGLGLLVILNRTERDATLEWARWVILLAMGGFLGNFALSLADHAQNGFFYASEWIGVISAAYAVGALIAVATFPASRSAWHLAIGLMVVQLFVGLTGFVLHLIPNLHSPMPNLWLAFVYGAPIFAPLLFADLAVLAGLGLWAVALVRPAGEEGPSSP